MQPTREWLEKWKKVKDKLQAPRNLEDYFTLKEIAGEKLDVLNIGTCSIPSGKLVAGDSLVTLPDENLIPYIQETPIGKFPVDICVLTNYDRYAAIRIKFNDNKAVYFENGMKGNEDLEGEIKEGDFYGFGVDAGMASITDIEVQKAYHKFEKKFSELNEDGDLYNDYFWDLLEENAKKFPKYQAEYGDWLNWNIPDTKYTMPICASGWGDGYYPVYFGYDENNNICQVVVHFIDIDLEFSEEK
ncbi:DUF4241 domain-containing protein [Fusobacterium animalis]|uniref:DUF4241 domain-containing protein n=1 Tax=Fusobacterium animalis TaxID=76859 RepID=UPI0030CAFD8C